MGDRAGFVANDLKNGDSVVVAGEVTEGADVTDSS